MPETRFVVSVMDDIRDAVSKGDLPRAQRITDEILSVEIGATMAQRHLTAAIKSMEPDAAASGRLLQ